MQPTPLQETHENNLRPQSHLPIAPISSSLPWKSLAMTQLRAAVLPHNLKPVPFVTRDHFLTSDSQPQKQGECSLSSPLARSGHCLELSPSLTMFAPWGLETLHSVARSPGGGAKVNPDSMHWFPAGGWAFPFSAPHSQALDSLKSPPRHFSSFIRYN